jgi:tRNA-dihydrouridine synthase B
MHQMLPKPRIGPISIGSVALDFPVVQAALSGYSDWAMRVVARRLGAPYTLCEVMLDQFLLEASHTSKNRRRLRVSDEEHPVGGQLMGANPEDFGPAALRLVEAGVRHHRYQFRLPGEKSARPMPRRLFARAS